METEVHRIWRLKPENIAKRKAYMHAYHLANKKKHSARNKKYYAESKEFQKLKRMEKERNQANLKG